MVCELGVPDGRAGYAIDVVSERVVAERIMTNARRALFLIASLALLFPILACGFTPEELESDESEATADPVVEPADPGGGGGGGGGGACDRVGPCCRAYVAAMGAAVPASTCDAYNDVANIPEATCESAISGYRSGLTALGREVPSECQ